MGVFPTNSLLWSGISVDDPKLRNKTREMILAGFGDPHVSKKSPSGTPFQSYGLCMVKHNNNQLGVSTTKRRCRICFKQSLKKGLEYVKCKHVLLVRL